MHILYAINYLQLYTISISDSTKVPSDGMGCCSCSIGILEFYAPQYKRQTLPLAPSVHGYKCPF